MKGTAKVEVTRVGGLPLRVPKVRFKRHRTARALAGAFFKPMGGFRNIVADIVHNGMWAFVDRRAKPSPLVHYWHEADANPFHLAYMLGHEIGHVSGRPLVSKRRGWKEEARADAYGAAAMLAFKRVVNTFMRSK